jgi:hypothetical protein
MGSMVKVSWRGEVLGLEICRDEKQTAELMERWDGVLITERIFEMPSASSIPARCNLANRVLRLFGESLVLDATQDPATLSALLQEASGKEPAPLPNVSTQFTVPPELAEFAKRAVAIGLDDETLKLFSPELQGLALRSHALTQRLAEGGSVDLSEMLTSEEVIRLNLGMLEAAELAGVNLQRAARVLNREPAELAEDGSRLDGFEELPLEERDPRTLTGPEKAELAARARASAPLVPWPVAPPPGALTGAQKRALASQGGLQKVRPRPNPSLGGRDPRELTGAEKRGLNVTRAPKAGVVPPVVDPEVFTLAEVHELGMLRASQGELAPENLAPEYQHEPPRTEREELNARRTWRRAVRPLPPELEAGESESGIAAAYGRPVGG